MQQQTENTTRALRAIATMTHAEEAVEAARADRDAAIVAMHHVDGLRPSVIARATGMSASNVRLVLRLHAAQQHPRGATA